TNGGFPTDTAVGDFEAAFAGAVVKVDQRYTTAYQLSQPIEPNNCLALWRDGNLTVFVSIQIVAWARTAIALTLRIDERRVRVMSPFVGGGFASKPAIHAETTLAALAARELDQPVKVTMTRQQTFHLVGNRAAEIQRVRLGAGRDGRLVAIAHEVTMH